MTIWKWEPGPTGHLWGQWCDVPEADAWITEAGRRTSMGERARLQTAPWAEQVRAVVDAWRAVSHVYRALNLPCLGDPAYKLTMAKYYGGLENQSVDAAVRQEVGPVYGSRGIAHRLLSEAWARLGQHPVDSEANLCRVLVQCSLSYPESNLVTQCLDGLAGAGVCAYSGWDHGCANVAATAQGCEPWDWHDWAWYTPPHIGVGGGESFCMIASALPPLQLSFDVCQELVANLAARGGFGTLDEARISIFAANLQTAAEARPPILPDELAAAANNLPANVNALRQTSHSPAFQGTLAALAAATAAVAVVPVAGPVVAAILAGVGALVALMPAAVGLQADGFGRVQPVLERAWIAGGPGEDEAPTYQVPPPPDAPVRPVPVVPLPVGGIYLVGESSDTAGGPGATPPGGGASPGVWVVGGAAVLGGLWWLSKTR